MSADGGTKLAIRNQKPGERIQFVIKVINYFFPQIIQKEVQLKPLTLLIQKQKQKT